MKWFSRIRTWLRIFRGREKRSIATMDTVEEILSTLRQARQSQESTLRQIVLTSQMQSLSDVQAQLILATAADSLKFGPAVMVLLQAERYLADRVTYESNPPGQASTRFFFEIDGEQV